MNMTKYELPEQLIAQVMQILNELPARVSRAALNEIEAEVAAQQAARRAAEKKEEVK